jgi:hypothetical protein
MGRWGPGGFRARFYPRSVHDDRVKNVAEQRPAKGRLCKRFLWQGALDQKEMIVEPCNACDDPRELSEAKLSPGIHWKSMWEHSGNLGIGPEFPEVHGRPVRELRPHDVIYQTRTLAAREAPEAAATAPWPPSENSLIVALHGLVDWDAPSQQEQHYTSTHQQES